MRILLVNRSAAPHTGGANRVAIETSALLQQSGHEVALAFWDATAPQAPCECIRVPGTGDTPADELLDAAGSFQPDVIQCHMIEHPSIESRLSKAWPVCHFIHDQGWYCSGGNRMTRDLAACHRPHGLACLAWHYLKGCGGKNPLGNWQRWQNVQSHRHINEHGDVRFQVASQFMQAGLMENGIPSGRIDLVRLFSMPVSEVSKGESGRWLVASRLVEGKGVDLLLHALPGLLGAQWSLAIAGTGPQSGALKDLSRQLGLQERVEWLGEISPAALDLEYRRCSLVISPTLRPEPFGLVGPEAMAHGRAIVAFDGGATPEWLAHMGNGWMIKERTPKVLEQVLQQFLSRPDMAERMGAAALAMHQQFSPKRYLDDLMMSFHRTIETHARRDAGHFS